MPNFLGYLSGFFFWILLAFSGRLLLWVTWIIATLILYYESTPNDAWTLPGSVLAMLAAVQLVSAHRFYLDNRHGDDEFKWHVSHVYTAVTIGYIALAMWNNVVDMRAIIPALMIGLLDPLIVLAVPALSYRG